MAIRWEDDGNGNLKPVMDDVETLACPTDHMDALQCDSCQ